MKIKKLIQEGLLLVDGKPVEAKKVDDLTVDFILPEVSAPFMSSIRRTSSNTTAYFSKEKLI